LKEKLFRTRSSLPVPYVGFDIPDEFVVGYGLDHAERYRNLRGIYRFVLHDDGG